MKKKILLLLLFVLVAIQFVPALPESTAEPQDSILLRKDLPGEVASILKKSCNDCHSNTTHWPWYAHIAPVSFWIGHHVEEGREHFNLSDWEQYTPERKAHKIEELAEEVKEEEMPLPSYTWLHHQAKLTDEERHVLITYFESL